mgnify:FL=1
MFLVASSPVPLFNTFKFPNYFQGKGKSIPLDNQGLMRCLETILLPGMLFALREKLSKNIYKIETPNYPGEKLYSHEKFLIKSSSKKQPINLLSVDTICETLLGLIKKKEKTPYLWGGNWPEGVAKMLELYPPADFSSLSEKMQNIWQLKGVDCSGLLYYATNGYTPRNTSDLVNYKDSVKIKNLTKEAIISLLEPLDLITWKGHVIIVIDKENCIESTPENGVHLSNLFQRIEGVLEKRKPVNKNPSDDSFVIRRGDSKSMNSSKMRCAK